jgi:hypothetical protein
VATRGLGGGRAPGVSQFGAGKVAKLLQAEFVARVEVAKTGNEGGPDVWSMTLYPNLAVPIPGLHGLSTRRRAALFRKVGDGLTFAPLASGSMSRPDAGYRSTCCRRHAL